MVATGAGETVRLEGALWGQRLHGWGFLSCPGVRAVSPLLGSCWSPGGITRGIWFVDNVQLSRETEITSAGSSEVAPGLGGSVAEADVLCGRGKSKAGWMEGRQPAPQPRGDKGSQIRARS